MKTENKMNKDLTFSSAQVDEAIDACGSWMLRNQITDRLDANKGRGIRCYDRATGYISLTGNWPTGIQCMCMLAMYKKTGEQAYLDAAELAGRYILSLQVMDSRDERYYGVIREITPQSIEFAPRDSTTAAWALVWLYEATKNPLYLDRAVLFGRWHLKNAMISGWPRYATYMDESISNMYAAGNFQSGTGLFYFDLFMQSGEPIFISEGFKPIAQKYRDDFFDKNGKLILLRDAFTGKIIEEPEGQMHLYNDDFGAAMLQTAADFLEDESYRQTALNYVRWLAEQQNDDGGFAEDQYPSGVPVSLMYFHDLGEYYQDGQLLNARRKALAKLLSTQMVDMSDGKLDGAFKGVYEGPKDTGLPEAGIYCVNNRTTSYALMSLLKISGEISDVWLGRFNEKFIDKVIAPEAINLKW